MTMSVAILPASVMGIFSIRWKDLIEEPPQVAQRTAFKFNGRQGAGGRWAENRYDAAFESAFGNGIRNLIRDVVNVRVAAGAEGKGSGFYWHI